MKPNARLKFPTTVVVALSIALLAPCGCSSGSGDGSASGANGGGSAASTATPGGAGAGGKSAGSGGVGPSAAASGGSIVTGSGGANASQSGGQPGASGGTAGNPAAGGSPGVPDGGLASGNGLYKDGKCFPTCGFPTITDPDNDGYGWEGQTTCLVATSPAAAGTSACVAPEIANAPVPGNGIQTGTTCFPVCSSDITDPDHDGYGYEHLNPCIVEKTAAALGGLPCTPNLPPLGMGNGIKVGDGTCHPLCQNLAVAMPDAAGFGYENMASCVVSTSLAALQGVPCDAPAPPPPPPPPPAPAGAGWNPDYTATMFGQADCAAYGFSDTTNLNASTCVARGAVQLGGANTSFFGATGDLATLWNGAPACTCTGGGNQNRCASPPACSGQSNCGQCVEIACNGTGTHSYMGDGFTHDEFCKPNASVVVQLIDACPHNHPNNSYWCTTARPNHIDLSCTAFNAIAQGRPIGEIGSINVYARAVSCNVGLGAKTF